ncbi:MAG: PilZ domain-containing protein [Oligoflexales bacterium]|nr:PilZ domain-containing protein [Oligoflexales bacterium]
MSTETEVHVEEEKSTDPRDYLTGPKKKKKDYVVFAFSESFDKEILTAMESFIKKKFPNLYIIKTPGLREMSRIANRQLRLIILDDTFAGLAQNINMIKELKVKKQEERLPVLFLTEDPNELVRLYNKDLLHYQEIDSYLSYRNKSTTDILWRIQSSLQAKEPRRSQRYRLNLSVFFSAMGSRDSEPGKILELSLHGAVLLSTKNHLFREREQIQIKVHKGKNLFSLSGDVIQLSAKVRRVFMGGNKSALSWEHLNDSQILHLTELLTNYLHTQSLLKSKA